MILNSGTRVYIDALGVSPSHGRQGVIVDPGDAACSVLLDGESSPRLFGASAVKPVPGRPFLRIAEHEVDDWTLEWRGWFFECRRHDGSVIATHPDKGLDGSQRMAFRHALAHLREGGCLVAGSGGVS